MCGVFFFFAIVVVPPPAFVLTVWVDIGEAITLGKHAFSVQAADDLAHIYYFLEYRPQ